LKKVFETVKSITALAGIIKLPPKQLFPLFLDAGFLPLILRGLHPDSLFMEKWMHKTASLCHRKQGFRLFWMQ